MLNAVFGELDFDEILIRLNGLHLGKDFFKRTLRGLHKRHSVMCEIWVPMIWEYARPMEKP
jgi:hypothetical protein